MAILSIKRSARQASSTQSDACRTCSKLKKHTKSSIYGHKASIFVDEFGTVSAALFTHINNLSIGDGSCLTQHTFTKPCERLAVREKKTARSTKLSLWIWGLVYFGLYKRAMIWTPVMLTMLSWGVSPRLASRAQILRK
jgi:hypothetical protein